MRLAIPSILIASLLALASCSGGGDSGTTSASSGSGSGGAGGGCPADSHVDDAGACQTTLTWETIGTIDPPRHHHTTIVYESKKAGPFLYFMGGFATDLFKDAYRAGIHADGSLGAWEPQTDLPSARGGHMTVVAHDHVILIGGMGDLTELKDVYSAPLDDQGVIGAWAPQPDLPIKRMHGAAALVGDTVYVVGGLANGTAIANVERGFIGADGSVQGWEELAALPAPRSHHALAEYDGYLYAMGGLNGAPAGNYTDYKDVLRAQIQPDGTLSAWETLTTLPTRADTSSTFVHDGYLYLVGGIIGVEYVAYVRRAPLLPDHTLGPWEDSPQLPKGRGHVHQTPIYQRWSYSIGGSIDNLEPIPDVFRGTFQ